MDFKEIEQASVQTGIPMMQPDKQLFVLAIKGLLSEFRSGAITKTEATKAKLTVRGLFEETKSAAQAEVRKHDALCEARALEDKILLGNLLHCNPYTLACQMARIVSLLENDSMVFFERFKADCYEIVGKGFLDGKAADAEHEEIEENLKRLQERLAELKAQNDNYGVNLIGRTIEVNEERLKAITLEEKKKTPLERAMQKEEEIS